MPITIDMAPLLALPADERREIAEALFDSVPEPGRELSPEFKAELDRRAAESDADPAAGIPWSEAYPRLLDRCRQ
jgi:putative addiction module component (TIGR02574 family)